MPQMSISLSRNSKELAQGKLKFTSWGPCLFFNQAVSELPN